VLEITGDPSRRRIKRDPEPAVETDNPHDLKRLAIDLRRVVLPAGERESGGPRDAVFWP